IVGADIDGIISAMMLASVAEWRVGALVMRNGAVLLAPGEPDLCRFVQLEDVFGVDVYSPLLPSVSNHPLLFGPPSRQRPAWLQATLRDFDTFIVQRTAELASINPSIWAGIGATLGYKSPQGFPYKYPLGTAQILV